MVPLVPTSAPDSSWTKEDLRRNSPHSREAAGCEIGCDMRLHRCVGFSYERLLVALLSFLLHNSRPVLVRFLQISLSVLVEFVANVQVVLHQEPTIHDLERFNLDRCSMIL